MATPTAETAVRDYLVALKDPSALIDDGQIKEIEGQLEQSDDELERLQLRQQLMDAQRPPLNRYEEAFVTHAKSWADDNDVGAQAFAAEGVPPAVLRRAGFRVGRGRPAARRGPGRLGRPRTRVRAEEVRAAIPKGVFTIKDLQERTGASPAVVRRIVQEEVQAKRVVDQGPDPDHQGPGRAPTLYRGK
ncbi:MAG: hypothetical protein M3276_09480 [Actinomycetota bacterium]|nr:hypothetical protein [Actinomycetota bacterium]